MCRCTEEPRRSGLWFPSQHYLRRFNGYDLSLLRGTPMQDGGEGRVIGDAMDQRTIPSARRVDQCRIPDISERPHIMPPRRTHRHPRLRGHAYDHGAYFVTLCTRARQHLFGRIVGTGPDAHLEPTDTGRLVLDEWLALPHHFKHLRLDQVQLMPDHLHAILILDRCGSALSGSTLRVDATGVGPDGHAEPGTSTNVGPDGHAEPGTSADHTTSTIARPRGPRPGSLGAILAAFKASTTYKLNERDNTPGRRYWQPGYHDRVIRTTRGEFERIARYIVDNPAKWR